MEKWPKISNKQICTIKQKAVRQKWLKKYAKLNRKQFVAKLAKNICKSQAVTSIATKDAKLIKRQFLTKMAKNYAKLSKKHSVAKMARKICKKQNGKIWLQNIQN